MCTLEIIDPKFEQRHATHCVVVPRPEETTLQEILTTSGGKAVIPDLEEDWKDQIVVRIADDEQAAMTQGELLGRIGQRVATAV